MERQEVIKYLDQHGFIDDEVKDMAIEALEKQIPKKPIIRPWDSAKCPSCNAELSEDLGDGYYKHWKYLKVCDCGQRLDWENEDAE